MTVPHPVTGKPLKHYAQDDVTKDRYIIIALQNDTDPDTCSVVKYDMLDTNMRAELIAAVNSEEFQKVPEIWKLLDKKYFYDYPNQTMLTVLRALKQIKVVKQDRVMIDLPGDMTMTPKQMIDAINQYEAQKGGVKTSRFSVEEPAKATTVNTTNDSRFSEIDNRINKLETTVNSLNSSIADLVSVIKQQVSNKPEE